MPSEDDVLRLIGEIYDAAVEPGRWSELLIRLADAMGADIPGVSICDFEAGDGIRGVAPRTDPAWLRGFEERWGGGNFLWQRSAALPVGAMFRYETFIARDELERTELYNDWLQPYGMHVSLVGNILAEGAASGVVSFFRSWKRDQFGNQEETLLAALMPHLQRALQLHTRLARLEIGRDSSVAMFDRFEHGALLVDASARVLFANRAAEAIFAGRGPLRVDDGRLAAAKAGDTAKLWSLIAGTAQDGTGGSLLIERENRSSLILLVFPLKAETGWLTLERPSAIAFIKDPESTMRSGLAGFTKRFGLTPAQSALMGEILKGDGVPKAAARLGVTAATARSHLGEIFQKTGTGRQAELIRLALEWQGQTGG